jgi:hypothetical protein
MRDPVNDPLLKGAAAAWHQLVDYVVSCAAMVAAADPTRMRVSSDYTAARADLVSAAQTQRLFQARNAAKRFEAAVDTSQIPAAGDENEAALIRAVITLRMALNHLDDALDQVEKRFPGLRDHREEE